MRGRAQGEHTIVEIASPYDHTTFACLTEETVAMILFGGSCKTSANPKKAEGEGEDDTCASDTEEKEELK